VRHKRSKRREVDSEAQLGAALRALGLPSWAAYLADPTWADVRDRVLGRTPLCEACAQRPPTVVHHRSYHVDALTGHRLDWLVACCDICLATAKREGRTQTGMNLWLGARARARGGVLFGLCVTCRKNPVKVGRPTCGECDREPAPGDDACWNHLRAIWYNSQDPPPEK
jgi:hypothetical protein